MLSLRPVKTARSPRLRIWFEVYRLSPNTQVFVPDVPAWERLSASRQLAPRATDASD